MDVPNLFIHSPIKGHLVCFPFLVIMNKGSINILHVVFCEDKLSNLLGKYLGAQLLNAMRKTMFSSVRNGQFAFQSV